MIPDLWPPCFVKMVICVNVGRRPSSIINVCLGLNHRASLRDQSPPTPTPTPPLIHYSRPWRYEERSQENFNLNSMPFRKIKPVLCAIDGKFWRVAVDVGSFRFNLFIRNHTGQRFKLRYLDDYIYLTWWKYIRLHHQRTVATQTYYKWLK